MAYGQLAARKKRFALFLVRKWLTGSSLLEKSRFALFLVPQMAYGQLTARKKTLRCFSRPEKGFALKMKGALPLYPASLLKKA